MDDNETKKKNKRKLLILFLLFFLVGIIFVLAKSCSSSQTKAAQQQAEITNEDSYDDSNVNVDDNEEEQSQIIDDSNEKSNSVEQNQNKHTIYFLNKNGNVLLKIFVNDGETPRYTGIVPIYSDDEYVYTFIGWDSKIKPAYSDAVYNALYSKEKKTTKDNKDNPTPVDNRPAAIVDTVPVGKTGLVYDGSPKELLQTLGQSSTGTMVYGVSTSQSMPTSFSESNPSMTNAGKYYVYYYSKGDASHKNSSANYIIVEVAKIDGSINNNPTVISSIKYNGSSQTLINAGTSNTGTIQYGIGTSSDAPTSFSSLLPTGKEVGTYYIWYYLKGDVNHNDTTPIKIEATIIKGDGIISKVPVLSEALEYTGNALPLITAGQSSTGVINYLVTTTNTKPGDTTGFESTIPNKTDKATYYVWYFADESDNYYATEIKGPLVAELTGTKCKVTIAPTAKNLTFINENQELINPGESTGTDAGIMKYAVMTTTDMPVDDVYSENICTAKNAGSYYVWYKAVPNQGDSNHSQSIPKSIEVKIAKAPGTAVAPTAKDLTYTGDNQVLITQSGSPTGTMKYMVSSSKPTSKADFKAIDNTTGKDAGTYNVWYYAEESDNYLASDISSTSVEVTIKKANGSITAPTANSLTYKNVNQTLVSAGTSTTGDVYYALGSETEATQTYSTTIPSGKDAGDYYVWYYSKGDINHNDTAPDKVKVTIDKADGIVTIVPTAIELEFTNEEQDLITTGLSETGTMYYYMNTSTEGPQGTDKFETSIPHGVNVGKYYVWYYSKGDSNHKDTAIAGPVEVEITKIKCKVTTPPTVKKDLVYNTKDQELIEIFGTSEGDDLGDMVYAVTTTTDKPSSDKYSSSNPKAKNAGTYYVWYKAVPKTGNTDHADSVVRSIEVKIAKAPGTAVAPTAKDLTYTGDNQVLITQSGSPTGTMKYMVSSSKPTSKADFKAIDNTTGKDAGTYNVWYYAEESDNYLATDISLNAFEITIKQHDVVFETPTANDLTYNGEEHSLITQLGTPSGTVKYLMTSDKTKPENTDGFGSIDVLKATNAFTGYVWYFVEESTDGNYKGLDICDEPLEVKIKKKKCAIIDNPKQISTVKKGDNLEIVSAGTSNDGVLRYLLTIDSTAPTSTDDFSTDVPTAENITTDISYVWYYVKAEDTDNYIDSDIMSITITFIKVGDVLYLSNNKKYRVIGIEDNELKLFDMANSGKNEAGSTNKYSTSKLKGYATTYYNGLSKNIKDAIIPKTITQYSYSKVDDRNPSVCEVIENQYVYPPSISDIMNYSNGDSNKILNIGNKLAEYDCIWLLDRYDSGLWYIYYNGKIDYTIYPDISKNYRFVFVVDIGKLISEITAINP